jgi:hypothetical protein
VRAVVACGLVGLALLVGCDGGDSASDETATTVTDAEFGAYPADTSLNETEVVEAYVTAIDERDGETFCRLVASWISGRLDLAGTDPDESLSRPLRCPQVVPALTDFPWENRDRFKGMRIVRLGETEVDGDLASVPVTITTRWEKFVGGSYEEQLDDVVWLTKEGGAWRVAKLGPVASVAALTDDPEEELRARPDVEAERRAFEAEVAEARARRSALEASYREVEGSASCPNGRKAYPDGTDDVVDYRHPAPPTPTPQLPAADIEAVHVHATGGRICALFDMTGAVRTGSTFDFAIESVDFEWGRSGFSQGFELELRDDNRARVTSGRDDERRPISVPALVGLEGDRLSLLVDTESFTTGRAFPGSVAPGLPLLQFRFRADVTVVLSEKRHLHDDLGPGSPNVERFAYP